MPFAVRRDQCLVSELHFLALTRSHLAEGLVSQVQNLRLQAIFSARYCLDQKGIDSRYPARHLIVLSIEPNQLGGGSS